MTVRLVGVALAVLAGSGCAHGFVCPAKGGPQWRELRTDHFVLRTNGSAGGARKLALELERIRDALAHGLFAAPPMSMGAVQVIVPRSPEEFASFGPAEAKGLFTTSMWMEPTIVLSGALGRLQREVVAHEMAHLLGAAERKLRPPWLGEGFACYAETLAFRGPEDNLVLGLVSRGRALDALAGVRNIGRVLSERVSIRREDYGVAWALVHFLLNEHRQQLAALEDRFALGEDPQAAWRSVFPQWDPAAGGTARLQSALAAYLGAPTIKAYVSRHTRLASIPPPVERALAPAEVHDLRLALWRERAAVPADPLIVAEAREALAEDAGSATAVAILSVLSREKDVDARAMAERATRARPDDGRTWALLAVRLPETDVAGRETALRRAIALDPENRYALVLLTLHLLGTKRAADALPFAKRAVELAPWNVLALDVAAEVLDALGNCRDALELEERAIAGSALGPADETWKTLVERRDRHARTCGERQAGSPP